MPTTTTAKAQETALLITTEAGGSIAVKWPVLRAHTIRIFGGIA